jgi:hypothetical protein
MLICTEKGFWPDELDGTLNGIELDRLVEHAMVCDFHRALLDRDDETFLSAFRAAGSLTPACARPSPHVWNDAVDTFFTAGASLARQPAMADLALKHYERFRRWERDRCPLEVLQARWSEHSVAVIELDEGSSTWSLHVEGNTTAIQFWTFCRLHGDQLLLATYALSETLCAGELSELQFANGQILGVSAIKDDGGDGFHVYLSCTPPNALRESDEVSFRPSFSNDITFNGSLGVVLSSLYDGITGVTRTNERYRVSVTHENTQRIEDGVRMAALFSPIMSQEEELAQKEQALIRGRLESKMRWIAWQVFDSSTPEERLILSLWAQGKTLRQVSEETGIPLATTHRRLKNIQRAIVKEVGKGIVEEIGEVRAEERGIGEAIKEVVKDRNYLLALLGNSSLDMARHGHALSVGR